MNVISFMFLFMMYHCLGLIIIGIIAICNDIIGTCDNVDFLSPVWQYKNFKVNWFGAIVLAAFFNILVPIISIGYWLRKLCTVGRK